MSGKAEVERPVQRFTAEPMYRPETEELRFLPECPRVLRRYPQGGEVLGWVAIQHGPNRKDGSFNLLDLSTGVNTTIPLPGRPGFFAETNEPGVVLVGMDRRFVLLDAVSGAITETGIVVTEDERVVLNEGLAIRGGLVFGTKHLDCREKIAALYHYDCGFRKLQVLAGEQICSNGKYYRAGQGADTLIDIDTPPKAISRYRIEHADEQIHERSLVIAPESLPALPDGLRPTPDGEGIVVAFYNPARVADGIAQEIRLADGAVTREWIVPGSPRVTCPEFVKVGGEIRLVVTTAVEGMPEDTRRIAPEAGTLFWAPTPFTSLPDPPPLLPACAFR